MLMTLLFLSHQNSKTSVELEMAHIMKLITKNKMTLNLLKTMEIVFHRPNISHDLLLLLQSF